MLRRAPAKVQPGGSELSVSGSLAYALRFVAGRFKGGEFPLRPNREIVVGRGSEYDMVLDEDMVSRRHAKIITMHGQIVLQDLKSTNGTFVNGERIVATKLKVGDKVLIGTSIMELCELEQALPGGVSREFEAAMPIGTSGPTSVPVRPTAQVSTSALAAASAVQHQTSFAMPAIKISPSASDIRLTVVPPAGTETLLAASAPIIKASKSAPREVAKGLSGRFPEDEVGLTDLLELFHANRRTGVLIVCGDATAGEPEARLAFRDGKLFDATLTLARAPVPISATKVVYRLLTWPAGDFRFDTQVELPRPEQELETSVRDLVLEGTRQWDELRTYEAHLPPGASRLKLASPLKPRLASLSAEALDTLQVILNAERVSAVLDESPASDLETSQDLLYLLQNGYVVVA